MTTSRPQHFPSHLFLTIEANINRFHIVWVSDDGKWELAMRKLECEALYDFKPDFEDEDTAGVREAASPVSREETAYGRR
ncbi:hypothetical protein L1887_18495 [Cichorium endivia]|nr:hypothetical protein L1887_18495 [Cichorium endivia]